VGTEEIVPVLGDHQSFIAAQRGKRFIVRNGSPPDGKVEIASADRQDVPGPLRLVQGEVL
jgi:hypothetical protein